MLADARSPAPRTAPALRQARWAITATLVDAAPSRPGAHFTLHPTSSNAEHPQTNKIWFGSWWFSLTDRA